MQQRTQTGPLRNPPLQPPAVSPHKSILHQLLDYLIISLQKRRFNYFDLNSSSDIEKDPDRTPVEPPVQPPAESRHEAILYQL